MDIIQVPDIEGPVVQLCWKQAPNMVRCDRRKGHNGPHSWDHKTSPDVAAPPSPAAKETR